MSIYLFSIDDFFNKIRHVNVPHWETVAIVRWESDFDSIVYIELEELRVELIQAFCLSICPSPTLSFTHSGWWSFLSA